MIIKDQEQFEVARAAVSRAELREQLIELWAQVFERELRADLEADEQAPPTEPADAVGPPTAGRA